MMCSLLTLLLTGCGSKGEGSGVKVPEPEQNISQGRLDELIHASPRPYVLVNFYATWCRPCKMEIPDLVSMQQDSKSEVEVILVCLDEGSDVAGKIVPFLQDVAVDFKTYTKDQGKTQLIQHYFPGWRGNIPLNLVFSKDGTLLEAFEGMTDRAEIEMIVNRSKKLQPS